MAGSTSRVLRLLELLQSAETRTVSELADRLEVNERTVRRYVQQLIDLDIPVESLRGRYGGYRIAAGLRVPPLMLDDDEAVVVVLALIQARSSTEGETTASQTALAKIRRSLPAATSRRLEGLLGSSVEAAPEGGDPPNAGILLTVAEAVKERAPLDLRYRNAAEVPSRRTVHPLDLIARSGRWYLVGVDVELAEERTFRIDRIRTARRLPGTFTVPSRSPDAVARLVDGFVHAERRWRVVLRMDAERARIRAHLPESVATLHLLEDGPGFRVEINAERLDWLPGVIAAIDVDTIIEQPDELRAHVRRLAERLLRNDQASSIT